MKPFIRWAGSKVQIIPELRRHWLGGKATYIEPFAGSACLFFDLEPKNALLGDLNWELVCTMRAVREQTDHLLECLNLLPRTKEAYYSIRAVNPLGLTEPQVAARFLHLNRHCFNGLYRTNSRGVFNVPYGPPRSGLPIDEQLIRDAAGVLQRATIINCDFEATLSCAEKGDFVYLDPPYAVEGRRLFSEYIPGSLTSADLPRLRASLERLDGAGVKFVITYADSVEARSLLAPWRPRRVRTRRNIAGFVGRRRFCYELLASNSEAIGA